MNIFQQAFTIAHSPDADDAFMFYAIAREKIDLMGYKFTHELSDIQTLNKLALEGIGKFDISAISYFAFPLVQDKYELMSSGSSMGENYGPILVTRKNQNIEELKNKILNGEIIVAVPGFLTSAYASLKLWGNNIQCVAEDFNAIQDLVLTGRYEAGVIIHEGQISWDEDGLDLIVDLGQWWFQITNGLPLPLGSNILRKDLPEHIKKDLNLILKNSIQYAIDHKEEALDYALEFARGLGRDKAREFVGMYVNKLTVDLGENGWKGVHLFYEELEKINLTKKPRLTC